MGTVSVKVEGIEKTLASLKKWQIIKRQACEDTLKKIGFKVEAEVKRNTGFQTQSARAVNSFSTNWSGSGMRKAPASGPAKSEDMVGEPAGPKGLVVVVGSNVKYIHMLEFGTWGDAPKPGPSESVEKRHESNERPQGGFQMLTTAYLRHEGEVGTEIGKIMGKDEKV